MPAMGSQSVLRFMHRDAKVWAQEVTNLISPLAVVPAPAPSDPASAAGDSVSPSMKGNIVCTLGAGLFAPELEHSCQYLLAYIPLQHGKGIVLWPCMKGTCTGRKNFWLPCSFTGFRGFRAYPI